jgi:hypothetical protein
MDVNTDVAEYKFEMDVTRIHPMFSQFRVDMNIRKLARRREGDVLMHWLCSRNNIMVT